MVEGKYVSIIAIAAGLGGFYLASSQSGKKMCNKTDFTSHLTTFQAACPSPDTLGIMKYYIGL